MISINLTQTNNITLKTKDKYCKDDIQIVQNLEEQIANPSEQTQEFTPSAGKNGISKFTINPIVTENVSVKSIEEDQVISASEGKYIKTINVDKINLENKTIVPTKERQAAVASQGYDGLKSTIVEPIPDEYIIPEGTLNINENGSYNVKDKESVNVAVPGEVVNLQDKTVTPTKEAQSVTADQGYTGLGTVDVEAIPNEYIIPSGNIDITENQVVDVTQYSQATISVPSSGGEDSLGKMLLGIPVDYVDTQRSVTFVSRSAMSGLNQYLNSIELPACSEIGTGAFATTFSSAVTYSWYEGLTKVSLPVCTTINGYAFTRCVNLSEVYAPELRTAEGYAFQDCIRLKELNFPKLEYASTQTFARFSGSYVNLPNLLIAGSSCFSSCSNVSEYSLPKLTRAGEGAFSYNTDLTSFYAPNLVNIGGSAFARCSKLSNITIDYENLETIPSYCFTACYSLSNFDAPNCLSINSGAFQQCSGLISVNFPKVTYIWGNAFRSCVALTTVSMPQCSIIYPSAFNNCINLSTVSFQNLTAIGSQAFSGCASLSTLILLSTSITRLSVANAFYSTPMSQSSYLGYFGSIYVPADLVDSYKTATNWTYFSDRITSIDNLPTV